MLFVFIDRRRVEKRNFRFSLFFFQPNGPQENSKIVRIVGEKPGLFPATGNFHIEKQRSYFDLDPNREWDTVDHIGQQLNLMLLEFETRNSIRPTRIYHFSSISMSGIWVTFRFVELTLCLVTSLV